MILRLGHAEFFVQDLEKSREFYVDVLGFVEADRDKNHVYLRGIEEFDKYTLILKKNEYSGLGHMGIRVSSPEDLEILQKKHAELGIQTVMVGDGDHPGQGKALRVAEPFGFPVEYYHQMEQISVYDSNGDVVLPMRRSHTQRGMCPQVIDHVNLRVTSVDQALEYWQAMDFSISEYIQGDNEKLAAWTRRKTSTHDVALVKADTVGLHHLAYRVRTFEDVVKAADLVVDAGYADLLDFGPGRHGATNAFYLYFRDPDNNRLEIYTGDYNRDLDLPPIRWEHRNYKERGMLWWRGETPPKSFYEIAALNKNWIR